jgi:AraC-like DNA-binding protein
MNGYHTQLLKLSKQMQRVTPELNIHNPYKRVIERVGNNYHPSIKMLYYELLNGIVRLHHVYSIKEQITVRRSDMMIALSLIKKLLLPLRERDYSDGSIDTYGFLVNIFGYDTTFTVKDAWRQIRKSESTLKRHLKELTDCNILERIENRKRYSYRINK